MRVESSGLRGEIWEFHAEQLGFWTSALEQQLTLLATSLTPRSPNPLG